MAVTRKNRVKIIRQVLEKALSSNLIDASMSLDVVAENIVDSVQISKYLDTTSPRYAEKDMVKVTARSKSGRHIVSFKKKPYARPL